MAPRSGVGSAGSGADHPADHRIWDENGLALLAENRPVRSRPCRRDQSAWIGIPETCFAVRMVKDVLTLATLGAGVRCVVRIS